MRSVTKDTTSATSFDTVDTWAKLESSTQCRSLQAWRAPYLFPYCSRLMRVSSLP